MGVFVILQGKIGRRSMALTGVWTTSLKSKTPTHLYTVFQAREAAAEALALAAARRQRRLESRDGRVAWARVKDPVWEAGSVGTTTLW